MLETIVGGAAVIGGLFAAGKTVWDIGSGIAVTAQQKREAIDQLTAQSLLYDPNNMAFLAQGPGSQVTAGTPDTPVYQSTYQEATATGRAKAGWITQLADQQKSQSTAMGIYQLNEQAQQNQFTGGQAVTQSALLSGAAAGAVARSGARLTGSPLSAMVQTQTEARAAASEKIRQGEATMGRGQLELQQKLAGIETKKTIDLAQNTLATTAAQAAAERNYNEIQRLLGIMGAATVSDGGHVCPTGQVWNGTACVPIPPEQICPAGQEWNGSACVPITQPPPLPPDPPQPPDPPPTPPIGPDAGTTLVSTDVTTPNSFTPPTGPDAGLTPLSMDPQEPPTAIVQTVQEGTTLDPSTYGTLADFERAGGQATDWYAVHGFSTDPVNTTPATTLGNWTNGGFWGGTQVTSGGVAGAGGKNQPNQAKIYNTSGGQGTISAADAAKAEAGRAAAKAEADRVAAAFTAKLQADADAAALAKVSIDSGGTSIPLTGGGEVMGGGGYNTAGTYTAPGGGDTIDALGTLVATGYFGAPADTAPVYAAVAQTFQDEYMLNFMSF